jgi:hypothetical protein
MLMCDATACSYVVHIVPKVVLSLRFTAPLNTLHLIVHECERWAVHKGLTKLAHLVGGFTAGSRLYFCGVQLLRNASAT